MSDDIYDPWDDTQPGYYDNAVQPAQREPTEPVPPTTKTVDLTAYQARCAQLWVDYRAGWCECDLCLVAHKPQPGKKRDPITGNGCPLGAAQFRLLQAKLAEVLDEYVPHGHPVRARKKCRCDLCTPMVGKLLPGEEHGLRGYQRGECRCEVCKAASAAYRQEMRERKAAEQEANRALKTAADRARDALVQAQRAEIEALRAALKGEGWTTA